MAETHDPAEAVREIRRLLADLLEVSEQTRMPVAQIMRLLDVVEGGLESSGTEKSEGRSGRSGRRGREARKFVVENTSAGAVLTERKPGETTPPFRVPRNIYDAVAQVLADANEPLRFEDILEQVGSQSAVSPADFQIRVCLRFLMSLSLLRRTRTKYHPADRKSFSLAAKAAWTTAVALGVIFFLCGKEKVLKYRK